MVKLRPRNGKQFFKPSVGDGKYKCEVDVAGSEGQPSYSITNGYAGKQLPITGSAVFDLLSPEQKQLLEQAQLAIDWSRVHRIADIQSTAWQIAGQGKFRKLTLELWTWPAGQVLELSAKVGAKRGSAAYSELLESGESQGAVAEPGSKAQDSRSSGIRHAQIARPRQLWRLPARVKFAGDLASGLQDVPAWREREPATSFAIAARKSGGFIPLVSTRSM